MSRLIEGEDRYQATLFPERLDAYMVEDSSVRVIDVFIDELDISGLGFQAEPKSTGRPGGGSCRSLASEVSLWTAWVGS
ncbi:MAG: hypothetical protein AAF515_11005 [Pseudomonadota bacterium]